MMSRLITIPAPSDAVPKPEGLDSYRPEALSLGIAQRDDGTTAIRMQIGAVEGRLILDGESRGHLLRLLSDAREAAPEVADGALDVPVADGPGIFDMRGAVLDPALEARIDRAVPGDGSVADESAIDLAVCRMLHGGGRKPGRVYREPDFTGQPARAAAYRYITSIQGEFTAEHLARIRLLLAGVEEPVPHAETGKPFDIVEDGQATELGVPAFADGDETEDASFGGAEALLDRHGADHANLSFVGKPGDDAELPAGSNPPPATEPSAAYAAALMSLANMARGGAATPSTAFPPPGYAIQFGRCTVTAGRHGTVSLDLPADPAIALAVRQITRALAELLAGAAQ